MQSSHSGESIMNRRLKTEFNLLLFNTQNCLQSSSQASIRDKPSIQNFSPGVNQGVWSQGEILMLGTFPTGFHSPDSWSQSFTENLEARLQTRPLYIPMRIPIALLFIGSASAGQQLFEWLYPSRGFLQGGSRESQLFGDPGRRHRRSSAQRPQLVDPDFFDFLTQGDQRPPVDGSLDRSCCLIGLPTLLYFVDLNSEPRK
eukprot:Protomagalhaensia_wolfi_Nauph_80__6059@NODE_846_length_1949_cov_53_053927_g636_i0_p2_GENE_NODE_846_length_1949_cov_53_053927_g636_i0NODE_846_length_1949_cov_53_053927_g636_i0_p2_ORF_typecomplete_len201_score15_96_NODE_846_length_1949_cov_53_053927_g636_i047649